MKSFSLSCVILGGAFLAMLASHACGGGVTVEDATSASSTGSTGQGGAGQGSTTTVGSSVSNGSGGSSQDPCEGLGESACIGNPGCAPVYEDNCCPTCDPGPCADCVSWYFHHCAERAEVCPPAKPPCGYVPEWACNGGVASCGFEPGSCAWNAGCVQGECSPDLGCTCIPEQDCSCRAVSGSSCTTLCNTPPPSCPPGMVAEGDGSCYTGWCIPAAVCSGG